MLSEHTHQVELELTEGTRVICADIGSANYGQVRVRVVMVVRIFRVVMVVSMVRVVRAGIKFNWN